MSDLEERELEQRWRSLDSWPVWVAWAKMLRRRGDTDPATLLRLLETMTQLNQHRIRLSWLRTVNMGESRDDVRQYIADLNDKAIARLEVARGRALRVFARLLRRNALPALGGAPDDLAEFVRGLGVVREREAKARRIVHRTNPRTRRRELESSRRVSELVATVPMEGPLYSNPSPPDSRRGCDEPRHG